MKELVPIVAAATIWGPLWSGSHVLFHCDNEAVITVLQNRNAHETTLVQLLQCLFFYSARFQFHFSATHIPSVHSVVADAISRNSCNLLSSHSTGSADRGSSLCSCIPAVSTGLGVTGLDITVRSLTANGLYTNTLQS